MTTVSDLLTGLQAQDPDKPLIFETLDGEIGTGYHVTELTHSVSKGIDCGGNLETWHEARLQLLDGQGSTHMRIGKFSTIVEKSVAAIPELAQASLTVEFAHGNSALRLMSIEPVDVQDDAIFVRLADKNAVCKPAQRTQISADQTAGRGSETAAPAKGLSRIFKRGECCA